MLGAQSPSPPGILTEAFDQARQPRRRKRKAEAHDNDRERLSKRLSLLNIEQNGSKLYVPVEAPTMTSSSSAFSSTSNIQAPSQSPDDSMQLDDSKHKVYIYNMDDELSSDSEAEGGDDDGRLVFLPDIEKHLKESRIPRQILANGDGELAGMQLVLYSDPRSLSVPEEKDGVRRAIIEARQRVRDRQRQEREEGIPVAESSSGSSIHGHAAADDACDAMEVD